MMRAMRRASHRLHPTGRFAAASRTTSSLLNRPASTLDLMKISSPPSRKPAKQVARTTRRGSALTLSETPEPTSFEGRPADRGVRARTFDHLFACAMRMTSRGQVPSVSELAAAAGVSRATAYRYFPSRSKLISAVIDDSLGPVRSWESHSTDGVVRVRELFSKTFPRFREYEAQMRAGLQLALQHWSEERADTLDEEPFRRGFRKRILERTAAPLKVKLGPHRFERLIKALSVIYGIEPYVVMKDIWGASDNETESLVRWMADAVLAAALALPPAGHRSRHD